MILMNNFTSEPTDLREAMVDAARRVIESGWYVLGKEVEAFEKQWASLCNVPHAIGTGNGMDALEIALRALDIGPGDEVITTSMTAFATVLAILRAGATPVLADIDPQTALLCRESVDRCFSPKTRAVVLVHLYGQLREMERWASFCTERNVALIEDCAQSHAATWKGKVAGSFGIAGAYSFYPTKNLGGVGDGGMLVTQDVRMAQQASSLRNYGQSERYYHPEMGMNSRLDEIQAAMLSERLKWLPEFTQRRQKIAEAYRSRIENRFIGQLAPPEEYGAHVYHLYAVTCAHRNALQALLLKNQIQTLIHYPVPLHHQAPCKQARIDPLGLSRSEIHAQTCISLPCHPFLTENEVEMVISAVNSFTPY